MGNNVPAQPWLTAGRLLGSSAERCSGELTLTQQLPDSPFSEEAAEAVPSLLSSLDEVYRQPSRAEPGIHRERGQHPAAARGSSAVAAAPPRGSGRPSAPRARTAPARGRPPERGAERGSAPRGRTAPPPPPEQISGAGLPRAGIRPAGRRPAGAEVSGQGPMVGFSCSSGAWRGRRGEESRPPRALPHTAPWSIQPEGDQRCLWG